ncbi:hypothetical protein ScPMuIL_017480 [Solemya velum]
MDFIGYKHVFEDEVVLCCVERQTLGYCGLTSKLTKTTCNYLQCQEIYRNFLVNIVKMSNSKAIVNVLNLGRMGFMSAYSIQTRFARQLLDELAGKPGVKGKNVLLLVEHNPVYTTGIRTANYDTKEEERLKSYGAKFIRTNRGGLITFHGHGQLVAYPILNLKEFEPSMKWYVKTLEKTMIRVCHHFGLKATTTENTGVWVNDKKIGAIGIHGSRFVTTHGVSLNCNTDLSWFKHIIPCGVEGKEVTSLSKELNHSVDISQAIAPFLEAFEKEFDCDIDCTLLEKHDHAIFSGKNGNGFEPLMKASNQKPVW